LAIGSCNGVPILGGDANPGLLLWYANRTLVLAAHGLPANSTSPLTGQWMIGFGGVLCEATGGILIAPTAEVPTKGNWQHSLTAAGNWKFTDVDGLYHNPANESSSVNIGARFYCTTRASPPPPPFWKEAAVVVRSPPPSPPPNLPSGTILSSTCVDNSKVFLGGCLNNNTFFQACGTYELSTTTSCTAYVAGGFSIYFLNGVFYLGNNTCLGTDPYFIKATAATASALTAAGKFMFQDSLRGNLTTNIFVSCIAPGFYPPPIPNPEPPPLPPAPTGGYSPPPPEPAASPPPPPSPVSEAPGPVTLKFTLIFSKYSYAVDYLPNSGTFNAGVLNSLSFFGSTNCTIYSVTSGSILVNTACFYKNVTCSFQDSSVDPCSHMLYNLVTAPIALFPAMTVPNVTRISTTTNVFFPSAPPPPPPAPIPGSSGNSNLNDGLMIAIISIGSAGACLSLVACYVSCASGREKEKREPPILPQNQKPWKRYYIT